MPAWGLRLWRGCEAREALSSPPYRTPLKPRASVQKISSTEMSKEMLVTASQVPGFSHSRRASIPAKKFTTLRCSTMTPLGLPVEPDV